MPAGSIAKPIGTLSLAGSFVPSGEKKRALDEVFAGRNIRSTFDGGRSDRPGYQDTEIDLADYNFTASKGFFGASFLKRLWLAGDNGTNVSILYADPVAKTVYTTGISLTTDKKVWFEEVEMDIYYGNGQNPMGRIIVGEVLTAAAAGDGEIVLKGGHGVRFPTGATFTAYALGQSFTYDTRSSDTLSGIPTSGAGSIPDLPVGTVITLAASGAAAPAPSHVDAPTVITEWFSTINIAGDPSKPRVWEFSKTAIANNPERYYDFTVTTNNELVGRGSQVTGFIDSNDYFYIFKEDGIWAVSRDGVNLTSGARPPLPFARNHGIPNPWCVCDMDGQVLFLTTEGRVMPITIITENNGQKLSLDGTFDRRVKSYLATIDKDEESLAKRWVFYNPTDQLAKIGVTVGGVREILVYDAQLGIFYPPDTNKDFDFMALLSGNSYAYSSDGQKIYLDEVGQYDDVTPVDASWETGRFGGEFTRTAFRHLYAHGKMTKGSIKYVTIYINGEERYTKTLSDRFIKATSEARGVGYAGVGRYGAGGQGVSLLAHEFQMPIGTFLHGQDIKIRVWGGSEDGGDFVQFDGFNFGATPRSKDPRTRV